jgi:predicted dehydrogenase
MGLLGNLRAPTRKVTAFLDTPVNWHEGNQCAAAMPLAKARALIVGLGSMGRRHLANLRFLAPQAKVCVWRRQASGDKTGEELADTIVFRFEDALGFRPQLAIICSPAPYHLEPALELARRGVPLLIEKPLSDRLDGVDELISVCDRSRASLLVGYNFRFCQQLCLMREAILQGHIGRLLSLRAEVGQYLPDWRPGRDYRQGNSARGDLGGGVLLELSHELDIARWLAGEVATVSAQLGHVSDLEIDVEDLAEITLGFASGAIGAVHLDMIAPAPSRSCRATGSTGIVEWNAISNQVKCFTRESGQWIDLHPAQGVDRNQMYLEEMRHFLACVAGEAAPRVDGLEGKRTLEVALAARESSRTGRTIELTPISKQVHDQPLVRRAAAA